MDERHWDAETEGGRLGDLREQALTHLGTVGRYEDYKKQF